MDPQLEQYLQILLAFHTKQVNLMNKLAPVLKFKPASVAGQHFTPTENSLEAQIKAWPDSIYLFPLGSWIEPRQGVVELADGVWRFTLHGTQEISFIHQQTNQDVTVTFSAQGDIGLSEWDMRVFLETSQEWQAEMIAATNARLFAALVEQGVLTAVPPKPLFEEEVFVLQTNRIRSSEGRAQDC